MNDDLSNVGIVREVVLVGDRNEKQQSRAPKRVASSTAGSPRKIHLTSVVSSPQRLTARGTAIVSASRANEGGDNVTYRLVQIPAASDDDQGVAREQNVEHGATAHIITTNGQGEFLTSGNQQIVLNSSGGLTFGMSGMQDSSPSRVAYVPANAISLATSSGTASQPIQLQSVDGGGGQYYIMLPTGGDAAAPVTSATSARIITPRLQRATFIPLSRLEPAQSSLSSVQPIASATATVVKQLDFHSSDSAGSHTKEIKRRVSHNEVEKRRRDKINNWITKLSRIVPNASNEYSAAKIAQSKGGVLAKTVEYIQELREGNEQLIEAIRHYESITGCLKEENKQLRDRLQEAGIEAPPPLSFEFPGVGELLVAAADTRPPSSPPRSSTSSVSAGAPSSELPGTSAANDDPGTSLVSSGHQYLVVQTEKGMSLIRSDVQHRDEGQSHQQESENAPELEDHLGQDDDDDVGAV